MAIKGIKNEEKSAEIVNDYYFPVLVQEQMLIRNCNDFSLELIDYLNSKRLVNPVMSNTCFRSLFRPEI